MVTNRHRVLGGWAFDVEGDRDAELPRDGAGVAGDSCQHHASRDAGVRDAAGFDGRAPGERLHDALDGDGGVCRCSARLPHAAPVGTSASPVLGSVTEKTAIRGRSRSRDEGDDQGLGRDDGLGLHPAEELAAGLAVLLGEQACGRRHWRTGRAGTRPDH